uniref:Secreted protein n=1 Tax=Heterorhabditis bacteriophora TaxID=37862 RepID=A0A1I7WPX7_HETBA
MLYHDVYSSAYVSYSSAFCCTTLSHRVYLMVTLVSTDDSNSIRILYHLYHISMALITTTTVNSAHTSFCKLYVQLPASFALHRRSCVYVSHAALCHCCEAALSNVSVAKIAIRSYEYHSTMNK